MMKSFWFLCLWFLPSVLSAQDSIAQPDDFEWLIGDWEGKLGKATISESWSKGNELTLIGEGATIVDGKVVVQENLQLHRMGGHLGYIASPNNAPPTFFTLISVETNSWVFENKEHDFPQRIIYSKKDENNYVVRIEGVNSKEEESSQEFDFTRKQ